MSIIDRTRRIDGPILSFFKGRENSEGNTINDLMQIIDSPNCTYTSDNTDNFMNWLFPSFVESQRVSSVPTLTQQEADAIKQDTLLMHRFNANVETMMNNWGFIRNTTSNGREYLPDDTYCIRYDGHTTQILLNDTNGVRFVNTGIKCMEEGPNQIRMSRVLQSMVAFGRLNTARSIVHELTSIQQILSIGEHTRARWIQIVVI